MADDEDEFVLEETHHPEISEAFDGQHGQRYAVFVQWERGEPHEYEESVVSSDPEMALSQAHETIDRRWNPESIWLVQHDAVHKTNVGDESLSRENTDKSFRKTSYYAKNMEMPEIAEDDEEVFGDD